MRMRWRDTLAAAAGMTPTYGWAFPSQANGRFRVRLIDVNASEGRGLLAAAGYRDLAECIDADPWTTASNLKTWMDEYRRPKCPDCGTPHKLRRKFNSGDPQDFWLPECDCEEREWDAEADEFIRRREERLKLNPPGEGSQS